MRVIILLVSALALTVAEDKASAETTDDGTKEDLSPEASGRSELSHSSGEQFAT